MNKSENKIQNTMLPLNHYSIHLDNQSRIGYLPQKGQQNPFPNYILSPEHRDTRLISMNNTSHSKKYPVQSKRENERYLGVDLLQLQNIKRKIH